MAHLKKSGSNRRQAMPAAPLGAALAAVHIYTTTSRAKPTVAISMFGSFLGPSFTQADIERRLMASGARFSVVAKMRCSEMDGKALVGQQAVGWFQGRMEFGPRSLGARSILGDPRSPTMQRNLNLKVKYRESFRPFAPSVLREHVADWFEFDSDSPYMLLVAEVRKNRRRTMTPDEHEAFRYR